MVAEIQTRPGPDNQEIKQPKLIIAVDLDDVLAKFTYYFCQYHNRVFGTQLSPESFKSYEMAKVIGISTQETVQRILDFAGSNECLTIKPVPGAIRGVKKLAKAFELVVVTSRLEEYIPYTGEWLTRDFLGVLKKIYFSRNHYSGRNGGKSKFEICQEIGASFMVEDSLEHALLFAGSDIRVLLFRRPWNKNVNPDSLPGNILPVSSWKQIVQTIEGATVTQMVK